jgi:hypothetical protein
MKAVIVLALLIALVASSTNIIQDPLVLTPAGYRHQSCVHGVESGASIVQTNEGLTVNEGARTYTIPKCQNPPHDDVGALPSGWAVYEMYQTTQGVSSYNGTWVTPGSPKAPQSQTLFTFTGLQNAFLARGEPEDSISIIQPVLQWGLSAAGGGQYWSIASWYVGNQGTVVYSTLKQISNGAQIVGTMLMNANNTWTITAAAGATQTTINVSPGAAELYVFVTLEVYSVTKCGDYPTGSIPYTNLAVDVGGSSTSPSWSPTVTPGCNEKVNTTNPSTVTIYF